MNNQITTYYIPNNPNIKSGSIYTLYINNNTNLDLTSIITEGQPKSNNIIITPTKITLEIKDYNKLLNINKQLQDSINKINANIEKIINEEKQTINNLIKLNNEYNNILKSISVGDKNV